ncbi:MAG: hypothetical protein ACRDDX_14570 [Cellulosilyticaceae bacterium]
MDVLKKEKVKLDEVLKFLFSTSNKVLVKLLNGIFDEDFDTDEVDLAVSNNEFVEDDLGILRGDIFFDLINRDCNKVSYHIEFQTKNDSTMVIRMFEYGFKKGKEQARLGKVEAQEAHTIYFPKQKVIFFEENEKIKDVLQLRIVFPDFQEVTYKVDVIKYWEYTDEELREKKMYPLMPLQLFNLRKELEKAHQKQDVEGIKRLSVQAKELATKLAYESKTLFESDELLGEDFHKMLLAIQNLIEYFNRNYFKNDILEEEVSTMTKTLYDPEVERRGIEKGMEKGEHLKAVEIARNLLKMDMEIDKIMQVTNLSKEEVLALQ